MGVSNASLAVFAGLATGTDAQTAFTYIALDASATAFAASQTALVSENSGSGATRVAATCSRVTTTQTNDTAQFTKTFTITGNVTVNAIGTFNDSSAGTMWTRDVLGATRTLVSGDSYVATVKVKFA